MAGAYRVLVALGGTVLMVAAWVGLIVAIMFVSLYVARLIPLTGWRRESTARPWLALRQQRPRWTGDPLAPAVKEDDIEALK
jgi:hypothetical protein